MSRLRSRIALVYLLTTGVLVGAMYFVIYISTSRILYSHYDNDLLTEFAEVGASLSIQDGRVYSLRREEWAEREHGEAAVSPVFLQATDSSGAVLRTSSNLLDTRLRFEAGRIDTFAVSHQLGTIWIRQVQGPIFSPQGELEGYLLVGMGIAEAKRLLDYLMWIMLLSFPMLLGVIVVISRLFGARIVRPIASLTSTADHITRENLDERVPLPKNDDELRQLSITLNSLLDRLQELILREQTFAADAAHELRTPLAVLKGTVEVLVRQSRDPQHYEEKLRYCLVEINRMGGLVDQLLLMTKYESGAEKLRFTVVDIAQCMAGVMERLDTFSRSKQIRFQLAFDQGTTVESDVSLITIVLENILSNAIKYSPVGATIVVKVREQQEAVEVSIKDQGPGMTPEQIEKVFNRFYRVESGAELSTKGFGLGLALVRRLAELLRINVSVTSTPGEGTRFIVAVPRQNPVQSQK